MPSAQSRPPAAGRRHLRLAELPRRGETTFVWEPSPEERRAMASALDVPELRKLRLEGTLVPGGRADWRLSAMLGASAVQTCVVTLEPLVTRVDVPVARSYLADWVEPEEGEVEMPEDDTLEPLPQTLDLLDLAVEALALALPDYPRAPGTEALEIAVTEPGKPPMTAEEARPFAGLKALRDRMEE